MPRYDKKSQNSVKRAMHKRKKGELVSGSGQTVINKKQAIAIGLSEARKEGAKLPSLKAHKTLTRSRAESGRSTEK